MKRFNLLPLEERAKILIREIEKHTLVENIPKSIKGSYAVEALEFLKSKNYIRLVGGTPKSGPRYSITNEGYEFKNN